MDDIPAHALLREALALLNDRPNFSLRRSPDMTSYRLASRIETYFARRPAQTESALERARRSIGSPAGLRFDMPSAAEHLEWLPAWIHVPCAGDTTRRLLAHDAALAGMPPMTREVFLAHRDRALEYPAIAVELGINVAEVEHRLSSALVRLDEAVSAVEDACEIDLQSGDDHGAPR